MNEQNIQRWAARARKPDGSLVRRADPRITESEVGGVKLTRVDLIGTIKATMRDTAKPNQRMIATIIDHAKGPQFAVAVGDYALITRSYEDIMGFLNSTTVVP